MFTLEVRENGTPTDPKKYLSSNYGDLNLTDDENFRLNK